MKELYLIWGPPDQDWQALTYTQIQGTKIFHHPWQDQQTQFSFPIEKVACVWVVSQHPRLISPTNLPAHIPILLMDQTTGKPWEAMVENLPNPIFWVSGIEQQSLENGLYMVMRHLRMLPSILSSRLEGFFVKQENEWIRLRWKDILWVKSDRVYQEIVMVDGRKWVIRQSLSETLNQLPNQFYRIHRSYAVNLDHVETIGLNDVGIKGHRIPMAKRIREELLVSLGL